MYSEYREKLSRRNARVVALWKWRFAFLAAILLLAAASVLLGMTGFVMSAEAAESCVYGQDFTPSGSALFKEVSFRYRAVGGEWTDETPIHAGSYEVQAVSHGLAGKPRYGKIMPFAITPAPLNVKVTEAEVDFGNLPASVTADNLKYGDRINFGDFKIEYGDSTADITPVKEDLRVFSGNGDDVTGDYLIAVKTKTVICNPIAATLSTADGSWVYDGEEHYASDIKAEGLLAGHTVGDIETTAAKTVGMCENGLVCRIYDEDGNDVTVHYLLEKRLGTLTVTARPVEVTTAGLSIEYDGTDHTLSNEPIGELAAGHTFGYEPHMLTLGTVGSIENRTEFTIRDAGCNDVTSNYSVTVKFGTLEIKKRPLTVSTKAESIVYDGAPHSAAEIIAEHIADGQSVVPSGWKSITEVGSVENDIEYTIRDAFGIDVTDRYDIAEDFGTLTVTARPVEVTTADLSIEYDGAEHTISNEPIGELAAGHTFGYELKTITLKKTGRIENPVEFSIEDSAGHDVAANYSVTVKFGVLEIKKRPLTIETGSATKVYDGRPLYCSDFNSPGSIKTTGLADGEIISYPLGMASITDAGSVPNAFVYYRIFSDGVDTTSNYEIEEKWGTLTVEPFVIRLRSDDVNVDYDGAAHGSEGVSLNSPLSGHVVKLSDWAKRTDAGSEPNVPAAMKVQSGSTDVTRNYSFDISGCGTITVKPRVIEVTTNGGEFVCDGTPKSVGGYTLRGSLLGGHTVYSFENASVTEVTDRDGKVGYADNTVKLFIRDDNSAQDVSDNYLVTGEWGQIRVKAPVVVRLFSLSKVYDGAELAYKPTDWRMESLPVDVEESWIKVELVGKLVDVGTLDIETVRRQSEVKITDDEGNDLLSSNRVDFVGEPLAVLARPLTVSSASAQMLLDGNPIYGKDLPNAAWISSGTLVGGHRAEFTVTGFLGAESTAAQNTFTVRIFDGEDDVTYRYDIRYLFGTLSRI